MVEFVCGGTPPISIQPLETRLILFKSDSLSPIWGIQIWAANRKIQQNPDISCRHFIPVSGHSPPQQPDTGPRRRSPANRCNCPAANIKQLQEDLQLELLIIRSPIDWGSRVPVFPARPALRTWICVTYAIIHPLCPTSPASPTITITTTARESLGEALQVDKQNQVKPIAQRIRGGRFILSVFNHEGHEEH